MSESALLIKAGRLAAEQHLILKTPGFPIQRAIKMVKPLPREQGRLTKRIQMGPTELKPWWGRLDNTWVWISPPVHHIFIETSGAEDWAEDKKLEHIRQAYDLD